MQVALLAATTPGTWLVSTCSNTAWSLLCVCEGGSGCAPHTVWVGGYKWMWPVTAGAVFVCSSCWRQWGHAQPLQSLGVLVLLVLLLQLGKWQRAQQQWQREGRPCVLSSCADVIKPAAGGHWLRWKERG